jgi:hypothetical protein
MSILAKSVLALGVALFVVACTPRPAPAPGPEPVPAEPVYNKY